MKLLYKVKSVLILLYIMLFIAIVLILDFSNIYKNTIYNQFSIKYINSDHLIEPKLTNFNNLLFVHYDKTHPIQKKGLKTYCLLTIENEKTSEIAIVEKGNSSPINLYKVKGDDLFLVKRIADKQLFNTSPFFIVSLESEASNEYILEYQDVEASYVFPRIVDIETWENNYKVETLVFSFLKVLILIASLTILATLLFGIFSKNKNHFYFLKWSYFKQTLKIILVNPLVLTLVIIVEKIFNFSSGTFFINKSEYLILFTILFSLLEYLVIYFFVRNSNQKKEVRVLSAELEEIKELNFDKIANIDNYSKTIALENLGKLFLFFDSEVEFLKTINENNYQDVVNKLKENIKSYKRELKERYDYLVPTNRIHKPENIYEGSDKDLFNLEKTITIVLFDNDEKSTYNYFSILLENNIKCLKIFDERKIIDLILKDEIKLLIINPYSTGEKSKELCSKIREIKKHHEFPIIMMNRFCSFFYIHEFRHLDINDFIIKPVEVNELIIRIKNLIYQNELYSKNNELALSEKEKNTFLYFITHNINTPLTILINLINDLSQEENLSEDIREDIEELQITSEEINQIIQNVLAAFRLNDGNFVNIPERIDIKYIIKNLKRSSNNKAKKKNQTIIWQLNNLPEIIKFDRTAFRGILNNLIDNAVKYSPYNSTIYVNSKRSDNFLTFDIINEGPVINDEELESLFSANSTISTKPTGGEISLGLGLNTSFKLAQLNNSSLTYKKTKDLKNLFSLIIPLSSEDVND